MFRFFLRNKKAEGEENPSRNLWIYGLGEFVLVFLGILIALQVENWNQDRQDRKLEQVLLSEMLSELKADQEDIEYNTRVQRQLLNSNRVVLGFMKSNLPWHDSLGTHFTRLMGGSIFDFNASAYESLKTIGIDLIRNDKLRQKITKVYTVRYTHVKANEEILFKFIFDHLYSALRENLHTVIPREMTVPVSLDNLRQNNSFMEDLNMNIFIYSVSLRAYRMASEDIVSLIADIEQELGMDKPTNRDVK